MTTIGYAYTTGDKNYLTTQLESLEAYGCDRIVIEGETAGNGSLPHHELNDLMETLTENDKIIVHDLVSLGKSVIQLADFVIALEEKNVNVVIIEKDDRAADLDDASYIFMIKKLAEMEKKIIRERTSRGLEEARRQGRIGGRPKIAEETVERIKFLYHHNKYTLRQIAEECDISLGTAYKYIQN